MASQNLFEYIEDNTLRYEASYRGGGIEIDLAPITHIQGAKMTAYQNYLGGGMLGSVQSDCNIHNWQETDIAGLIENMQEALKRYFHNLTNHEDDEWESQTYEQNQNMPKSAY